MPRVKLIQIRGGTASAWTTANPVLALREPGYETDTRKQKVGDGVTSWNSLPYVFSGDGGDVITPIWEWAAHSNDAPVSTSAGQTWITKGEYLDGEFLIEDGSFLIAKGIGASTVDPGETEFWIK